MNNQDPHTKPQDERQLQLSKSDRFIVIGASAGGFEAIKTIVKGLPPDFTSPVFIIWHMSANVYGILPTVLNRENSIYAAHGFNNEEIKRNRIYVAPPDHHMLIKQNSIQITHGPKENRFRPAIDPLFRSAAYHFENRVIGIILSGALDDGTAGLWTIKHYGGMAIAQNPLEAEVPSMAANAIRMVNVDYTVSAAEIPDLLVKLTSSALPENQNVRREDQTRDEIEVAAGEAPLHKHAFNFDELPPFTCPECHGVLSRLRNGNIVRYRCHTGHAYSVDALMETINEKIEEGLYKAMRAMDESIMLMNHIGDHYAENNEPKLAALYFKKAKEAQERSNQVRQIVQGNELLNREMMYRQLDKKS